VVTLPTDERVVGHPALLRQRHGQRRPIDRVDVGGFHLVTQPRAYGAPDSR
jgi:hypothetical protein